MRFTNLFGKKAAILAMFLVASAVSPSGVKANTQWDAADLLQEIEANVLDVREHAARLKSYTRFPESYSWSTHYFDVSQIKQRMNRIADLLEEFKTVREKALPGQNTAFDRIVPEAVKVADLVEKTIQFLDNNKVSLAVTEFTKYKEWVDNIYDRADLMAKAIDLAETRAEITRLKKEESN